MSLLVSWWFKERPVTHGLIAVLQIWFPNNGNKTFTSIQFLHVYVRKEDERTRKNPSNDLNQSGHLYLSLSLSTYSMGTGDYTHPHN